MGPWKSGCPGRSTCSPRPGKKPAPRGVVTVLLLAEASLSRSHAGLGRVPAPRLFPCLGHGVNIPPGPISCSFFGGTKKPPRGLMTSGAAVPQKACPGLALFQPDWWFPARGVRAPPVWGRELGRCGAGGQAGLGYWACPAKRPQALGWQMVYSGAGQPGGGLGSGHLEEVLRHLDREELGRGGGLF